MSAPLPRTGGIVNFLFLTMCVGCANLHNWLTQYVITIIIIITKDGPNGDQGASVVFLVLYQLVASRWLQGGSTHYEFVDTDGDGNVNVAIKWK